MAPAFVTLAGQVSIVPRQTSQIQSTSTAQTTARFTVPVHVIPNGRALTAVMRHTARDSWRNSVSIVPDTVYALAEIAHATCNGVGLIVAFQDVSILVAIMVSVEMAPVIASLGLLEMMGWGHIAASVRGSVPATALAQS